MPWYRTGTISVANGSPTVMGAGTAFVANVRVGYALVAPDGRTYEIAAVVSNTQLTLASNYLGSNAAGQAYSIYPTQSVIADLATAAAALINSFAAVRDGVGQGLFPDGTAAAPGFRFANDQDTGVYRPAANQIAFAVAGAEQVRINATGLGIGVVPGRALHVSTALSEVARFQTTKARAEGGIYASFFDADGRRGFIGNGVPTTATMVIYNDLDDYLVLGTASLARLRVGGSAVSGAITPGSDNTQSMGVAGSRWATFYGGSGTINTSDEREKTWRGALSEAEYEAGLEVLGQLGFYQWNDMIAEKGSEGARYHFGVRAQQVWAIFADHDLVDPITDDEPGDTPYAFLCFDKWSEEREPILDNDGVPTGHTKVTNPGGTRFGIRPDDLNLFLHAVQARRMGEIEARLALVEAAE